jgi:ADP-heptose:LPS heptosyltransferase
MKILLIKLGALGDVVRSSYLLHGIRKKCEAAAHINWVTSERAVPLLKHHSHIDVILTSEGIVTKAVPWACNILIGSYHWMMSLARAVCWWA